MTEVTDPDLISQLDKKAGVGASATTKGIGGEVTDPELIAKLEGRAAKPAAPQVALAPSVAPSYLSEKEKAFAEELGRSGMGSGSWQGFTGGLGGVIEAGVAAPLMYAQHKFQGKDTSLAREYWRNLEMSKEIQKAYENSHPLTAASSEAAGMLINPAATTLAGPAARLGARTAGAIASRIPAAYGGKAIGAVAGLGAEAGTMGASLGAEEALGHGENLTPSEYVTKPLGGAVAGGVGAAALSPFLYGGAKAVGWGLSKLAPPLYAAMSGLKEHLPEAARNMLFAKTEQIAKQNAAQHVASAIEETGNTINARAREAGRPEMDPLDRVKKELLPPLSPQLMARNLSADNLEDMLTRADAIRKAKAGGIPINDTMRQIAADHGVHEDTVAGYYSKLQDMQRTPTNLVEHVSNTARKSESKGAEIPLQELTRVAAGSGGAEKSALAAELGQRQIEQGSRISRHIEKAAEIGAAKNAPQNFNQAIRVAAHKVGEASDAAYNDVRANNSQINLTPELANWTRKRVGEMVVGGEEHGAIGKAIRLFSDVHHEGFPPAHPFGTTIPGSDANRFLAARRELDIMMEGASAPLHRTLTQFRNDMNTAARAQHENLAAADSVHHEGKAEQKILDRAIHMSHKLNESSRDDVDFFDKLTPEQKDLFKLGFGQKLKEIVESSPEGSAGVAGKFTNVATKNMVKRIFGSVPGEVLNEDIAREATTTQTLARAFGGSQTTPWRETIRQYHLGAQLPSQVALGHWGGAARTATDILKYHIANRQATHIGQMLTNSDPIKNLETINILKQAQAQRSAEALEKSKLYQLGTASYAPVISAEHNR